MEFRACGWSQRILFAPTGPQGGTKNHKGGCLHSLRIEFLKFSRTSTSKDVVDLIKATPFAIEMRAGVFAALARMGFVNSADDGRTFVLRGRLKDLRDGRLRSSRRRHSNHGPKQRPHPNRPVGRIEMRRAHSARTEARLEVIAAPPRAASVGEPLSLCQICRTSCGPERLVPL